MNRQTWWVGLALAAVLGCGETKENELPPTNPSPAPAGGAAATPEQPTAKGGGMGQSPYTGSSPYPAGYPKPKLAQEKAASEAAGKEEAKQGETKKEGEGAAKKEGEPQAAVELTADEIAEIKKLPDPKDRERALAQKVCPVSEEHLGMDVPIKKVVDGKTVFLCCKSCVKDFDKDPKGFLAKAEGQPKK